MPSIVAESPSLVVNDASAFTAWANPENAGASDNAYATVLTNTAAPQSKMMLATGWNLDIDPTDLLDSIAFTIEVKENVGAGTSDDLNVFLWDGTTLIGADQATGVDFATDDTDRTYTWTDLEGLTASMIALPTFGVTFAGHYTGGGLGSSTVSVDAFKNLTAQYHRPGRMTRLRRRTGARIRRT